MKVVVIFHDSNLINDFGTKLETILTINVGLNVGRTIMNQGHLVLYSLYES